MRILIAVAAAACAAVATTAAKAQSIADRVASVRDGMVRMTFQPRPGVCVGDDDGSWWTSGRDGGSGWNGYRRCTPGMVVVTLERANRETVGARGKVLARRPDDTGVTDLGIVPSVEAARYLTTLVPKLGGRAAEELLSAAAVADGFDAGSAFRPIVLDDNVSTRTRKDALFWIGQSDAPTKELVDLDGALRGEDLREQYVFVLSQRRDDQAIDKLIDVARTDHDMETRKHALFWLGQSHDPRAIKLLRDLITK